MAEHTYDLDEVRAGIRAIVDKAGPDNIYIAPDGEGCVYITSAGEPSCLIGHYLRSIGVSDDVLRVCDTRGSVSVILNVLDEAGYRFSDQATKWMRVVQARQDAKHPWGRALEYADEELSVDA